MPITALSNKFVSSVANRHKYQGNEYLEANELRWMDFRARQYDTQLGRFWGIDPLAYSGGQQVYSPYAAMGNAPGEMIDPNGEMSKYADGVDYGLPNGGRMSSPSADRAWMDAYFSGKGLRGGIYGSFGAHHMFFACGGGGTSASYGSANTANDYTKMPRFNAEPNAYGLFVSFWYISSVDGPELSLEYLKFIGANIDDYVESVRGELPLIASGGQQQNGGDDRWLATDITGAVSNGLMIPDAAFNFANTKTGKLLSMGGAHAYQSMPRAQQIAAVRELQLAGKLAKPLTRGIAVVNVLSTATAVTNDFVDGRYKSGGVRVAVWGVAAGAAFIPVAGWAISAGIGIADAIWGDDFYNYVENNW